MKNLIAGFIKLFHFAFMRSSLLRTIRGRAVGCPRTYGWKKDVFDARDHVWTIPKHMRDAPLPPSVDWSQDPAMPPVYDQMHVGSCTGNSVGGADHYRQMKDNPNTAFQPSRLFLYWNGRDLDGDAGSDCGAQIRNVIRQAAYIGVCPESAAPSPWPYEESQVLQKPDAGCFLEAGKHKVLSYESVSQDLTSIKTCLAAGYVICFGMQVYSQFQSEGCASDGIVEMPNWLDRLCGPLGGHAVLCVGYDDVSRQFIVRNSWSEKWGIKGYFRLPYAYMLSLKLVSDLWVIHSVEEPTA